MFPVDNGDKPLYRQVADDITARIDGGTWPPGTKLPSERALCELYDVSQITVRRALRDLSHLGRLKSRHGLGWFASALPAQGAKAPFVTVLLRELDWLASSLLPHLASALCRHGIGAQVVFRSPDALLAQCAEEAAEHGSKGLVIAVPGAEPRTGRDGGERVPDRLPILHLVRRGAGDSSAAAVLDETAAMIRVTRHMLSLGHRRLAYLGSAPGGTEGWHRYRGFAQALWGGGVDLPLEWMFSGRLSQEDEKERFRQVFLQGQRPTALVCSSDLLAARALTLLGQLALKCPDHVAIVGMGDHEFAPLLAPPLTTFAFDLPELAEQAAIMVLDLISDRPAQDAVVSGRIVVRSSCGAKVLG